MRKRRKFDIEFKKQVVEDIESGVLSVAQAIRKHDISHNLICQWTNQYEHGKLNNEPTEL